MPAVSKNFFGTAPFPADVTTAGQRIYYCDDHSVYGWKWSEQAKLRKVEIEPMWIFGPEEETEFDMEHGEIEKLECEWDVSTMNSKALDGSKTILTSLFSSTTKLEIYRLLFTRQADNLTIGHFEYNVDNSVLTDDAELRDDLNRVIKVVLKCKQI